MSDFLEGVVASEIANWALLAPSSSRSSDEVILFSSKVITIATILVTTVCHLTMRVVMLYCVMHMQCLRRMSNQRLLRTSRIWFTDTLMKM